MQTFVDLLEHRAATRGSAPLFRHLRDGEGDDDLLSYAQAARKAQSLAAGLADLAAPGARVLLIYPSGNPFLTAFLGTMYAGMIPVPVYPPSGADPMVGLAHIGRIASDCGAELVLTTADMRATLGAAIAASPLGRLTWLETDRMELPSANDWRRPDITSESIAFLQYTSGSTAAPKGVMLTHGSLLANLEAIREAVLDGQQDFTVASWLPLYHDLGLIGYVLAPIYAQGGLVFITPQHFIQRPIRWLRMIDRYDAYISAAPNFAFDLCARAVTETAKAQLDLSRWRVAMNCSEPVRLATLRRFQTAFEPCGFSWKAFCPAYGLAESTLLVTGARPGEGPVLEVPRAPVDTAAEAPRVSSGRPPSGIELAIVDLATLEPSDDEGEIWVRSASTARGYWGKPELSQATFAARLGDTDGWLRTGDLGRRAGEELIVTGRIKDVIIIGGRKIYPQDVEDLVQSLDRRLRQSGGVAFGTVGGSTEKLVLVQELTVCDSAEMRDLVARARALVAAHLQALLDTVVFIPRGTIPKTLNGKLRRAHCKALFEAGDLPQLASFSAPAREKMDG